MSEHSVIEEALDEVVRTGGAMPEPSEHVAILAISRALGMDSSGARVTLDELVAECQRLKQLDGYGSVVIHATHDVIGATWYAPDRAVSRGYADLCLLGVDGWWLTNVFVGEHWRKRGAAKHMITSVLARAEAMGVKEVKVIVGGRPNEQLATVFFGNFGFKPREGGTPGVLVRQLAE